MSRTAFFLLLIVIETVVALLLAPCSVGVRSWQFGFSAGIFAWGALILSLFTSVPALGAAVASLPAARGHRSRASKPFPRWALIVILLVPVLPLGVAEAFCGFEEARFRQEVVERGHRDYSRDRWFASSSRIGYDNETGRFYAHD